MSETDTIPVFVVQSHPRSEKTLAARGFGWPQHNETEESNQEFINEMQNLKTQIDVTEIAPETKVAELTICRSDETIKDVEIL